MTRLRTFLTILLPIAAMTLSAGQAWACRSVQLATLFLHDELPDEGQIAAEVVITRTMDASNPWEFEARIIRMLRGEYSGERLLAKPSVRSGCDSGPTLGERGIIVGTSLGSSSEALILDPLRTRHRDPVRYQIMQNGSTPLP